jgi:hypothetical protein
MAAILLLPGFGGKYTSENFTSASTTGADTIDTSHVGQLLIQVRKVTGTPNGTVQLQNSNDNVSWANYGNALNVATDGTVTRVDLTAGPPGLLRFNCSIAAGTVYFTIVGFPIQVRA